MSYKKYFVLLGAKTNQGAENCSLILPIYCDRLVVGMTNNYIIPQASNSSREKLDFLKDNRTPQQYFDDIRKTQEIEDQIINRFALLQGISCKPVSPRETLRDLDKVQVFSDYFCDKFGLIEVKFHYNWQEELGFKKYQLLKYKRNNVSILLVNNWNKKPMFALVNKKLLSPEWILLHGKEPSQELKKKAGGKFDIMILAKEVEWRPLL